jgi:hypothetical protein
VVVVVKVLMAEVVEEALVVTDQVISQRLQAVGVVLRLL